MIQLSRTLKEITTPWIKMRPTEKELKRLNIDQLLVICMARKHKSHTSFKKLLIDFILQIKEL